MDTSSSYSTALFKKNPTEKPKSIKPPDGPSQSRCLRVQQWNSHDALNYAQSRRRTQEGGRVHPHAMEFLSSGEERVEVGVHHPQVVLDTLRARFEV
jgi:hypothetical protein